MNLATHIASILSPPLAGLSADALLTHFHVRGGVEYFPILDAEFAQAPRIDAVLTNEFEWAGERHRLPDPPRWLENPSTDIEWQILLHKFYFAVGLGARFHRTHDPRYLRKWMSLTDSWIETTPPLFIAGDVTGRRIQNWIYAHYYFVTLNRPSELCAQFYARFQVSLHAQVAALRESLAPARNHRTLELHAIFLAAVVFPEWREATQWRDEALAAIVENARADLLADGVHCELSTDYHHLVLRNFLAVRRLARLNAIEVPREFDQAIERALEFSMHVHQPSGNLPAFSDGDTGDYRELLVQGNDLYARTDMRFVATAGKLGTRPTAQSRAFPASGYYVMRSGWGEERPYDDEQHLVIDCGPLGAGNHGHFDCLSFELAAHGRALVVDPGRYTYDEPAAVATPPNATTVNWRAWFRGTAAHNTVQIDRAEQTRYVQGPKRMKVRGEAPRTSVHAWAPGAKFDYFHGQAASSEYPVTHERVVLRVASDYWVIADFLASEPTDDALEHRFDLRFHLDPSAQGRVELTQCDGMQCFASPHLLIAQCDDPELAPAIDAGWVSHRYGEKSAAPVVRWTRRAGCASFVTVLMPFTGSPPVFSMREVPVWTQRGTSRSRAFRVSRGAGSTQVSDTWIVRPAVDAERASFGGFRLDGRYAFVRENAFGETLAVCCDAAGRIEDGGFGLRVSEDWT